MLVVGNFFGIEQVAERLQETSIDSEHRDEVTQDSLEIIRDYPATGSGAGSFYSTYPMYDTGKVGLGFYKHAHNDYVEFASELGLLVFCLLGYCVLLSLWQAVHAQLERHDRMMQGMGFAATMTIIALLMHSAVDFNLQIPANAAMFMIILALAWVARHCGSPTRL
jgi:O-antigen ligase